jgi:hypothetical protein
MKMLKKLLQLILNGLWRIQFKAVPFEGPNGYHCRNCVAGQRFFCGSFYCPLDEVPTKRFEWRFNWKWYQKFLAYGAHKLNP